MKVLASQRRATHVAALGGVMCATSAAAATTQDLVFAYRLTDISKFVFDSKSIEERDKTILLSCLYLRNLQQIVSGTRIQLKMQNFSEKMAPDMAVSLLRYCETVPLTKYEKTVK